jgi:hypothetical protein
MLTVAFPPLHKIGEEMAAKGVSAVGWFMVMVVEDGHPFASVTEYV